MGLATGGAAEGGGDGRRVVDQGSLRFRAGAGYLHVADAERDHVDDEVHQYGNRQIARAQVGSTERCAGHGGGDEVRGGVGV
eukprot:scaffold23600_cov120-Isochrysis_galbana.AAC.4